MTAQPEIHLMAGGQDWDDIVTAAGQATDERIVVNMGPQHPSTHGVLRLILEIEGETVTDVRCGIGYLHTGIEKIWNTEPGHRASPLSPGWTTCLRSSTRLPIAWA